MARRLPRALHGELSLQPDDGKRGTGPGPAWAGGDSENVTVLASSTLAAAAMPIAGGRSIATDFLCALRRILGFQLKRGSRCQMFFFGIHLRAPRGTEPHVALTLQFILL